MIRTELYVNNILVDLKEDFVFDLNFQISDITRPESKQANYSKTIEVPSTKTNDILFSHIFSLSHDILNTSSVNFNPDFNPNLKAEAQLFNNSAKVFDGIIQLTDIKRNDHYDITYEIILLGNTITPFSAIGDKYMSDLDLSEFDHEYNKTNIVDSWDNQIIQNAVPVPFQLGNGYVYPFIDYGQSVDLINFEVEHFKPAFYVKELWDKIWSDAGFTVSGTFPNSTIFKSLIIPHNSPNLRLTGTQIMDRQFRASYSAPTTLTALTTYQYYGLVYNDETTSPNYDSSAQYDNTTGIFEVSPTLNGTFNFTGQLRLTGTFTPSVGYPVIPNNRIRGIFRLQKDSGGTITTLGIWGTYIQNTVAQTGAYTTTDPAPSQFGLSDPEYPAASFGFPPVGNHFNWSVSNIRLNVGDKVYMEVQYFTDWLGTGLNGQFRDAATETINSTGTYELNILSDSYIYATIADPNILEGQTMLMNNILPNKVKQKDFILSLVKCFNLYIDINPDVTNEVIIETRDDFFTNNVQDWTLKLDNSQDLVIRPMGALEANQYIFKHKEDKDYYNQRYKTRWGEDYGTRTIDVVNDFNKNKKVIDTIFSPSPLVGNDNFDRIITPFINVDSAGIVTPFEGNIRLLYYGGMKDTNSQWFMNEDSGTLTAFDQYPYAGHLDDPYNPTIDLNFGVPFEIFYDNRWQDINYSNGNLYNRYWKKQINEITDKNSKMVTGYFNLKPIDISTMSFRDLYYFDKNYFRLNKIIGYNPNAQNLTQCEFIKLIEAPTFVLSTLPVDGSVRAYTGTDEKAPLFGNETFGNNVVPVRSSQNNNQARGQNNVINQGSRNCDITGNNNIISGYCKNVTIISDGVSVDGNLENIFVFNSPDITVTESNVVIINGQYVSGGDSVVTLTAGTYSMDTLRKTFLCDCSSGDITINLPPVAGLEGTDWKVKRIDKVGQYKVYLIPDGSELIDNAIDYKINKENLSVTIQPNESGWWLH